MDKTGIEYGPEHFSRRDSLQLSTIEQDEIPSAYRMGMSPTVEVTTIRFASRVVRQLGARNVIDIGCGKGYLDRILGNIFGIKVLCVDKEKERLRNTLKWNRLIQEILEERGAIELNGLKYEISGNLCTMAKNLETKYDLQNILVRASTFFTLGKPINVESQDVTMVALKICGDFIYDFVDNFSAVRELVPRHLFKHINFAIVPCCVEKSKRFPASQNLPKKLAKDGGDDVIMLDMYLYMIECKDIANADVCYLNDGYYIFSGEMREDNSRNKGFASSQEEETKRFFQK